MLKKSKLGVHGPDLKVSNELNTTINTQAAM